MRVRTSTPFEVLLGLLALLVVWALLAVAPPLPDFVNTLGFLLVAVAFTPDGLDLIFRVYRRSRLLPRSESGPRDRVPTELVVPDFDPHRRRLHLRPWAIVLSVHNLTAELQTFLAAFEGFRDLVWVIDDCSDDGTASLLENAGVHCVRGSTNRHKPGAIRRLLSHMPAEIETVLVMDPDTRILSSREELETVVFDLQRSGKAAVTPRIDVAKDGLVANLQRFEYFIALGLGRKSLGATAVTSGIAFYRRADLERALEEHTLSVYAEDLETSLILLASGGDCYYDDRARFETEGMTTWSQLFSQRVGWSYGLLRVFVLRFPEIRRIAARGPFAFYQFLIYLGVLCIAGLPLRVLASVAILTGLVDGIAELAGVASTAQGADGGIEFVSFYLIYLAMALFAFVVAVPAEERRHLAPSVPLFGFFALFLVVPTAVGYLNWVTLRLFGRRIYRDHYEDEQTLRRQLLRPRRLPS